MADTKKVATAAVGVAATVAVALSGSGQSLPDAAAQLQAAVEGLFAKSVERGVTLPDAPGVRDVTAGMEVMVPTTGETMTLEVAQGGDIDRGDALTLCHQYEVGTDISLGGGELLAATTAEHGGRTYAAIVYNRAVGDDTERCYAWLLTLLLAEDGTAELGDLVILESEPLTEADVALSPVSGMAAVVYPKDGAGWAQCVQIRETGAMTVMASDAVFEDGAPCDLHVAVDDVYGVCISCVRTVDDVATASVRLGLWEENTLRLAPASDLDLAFDPAAAPDNWDLAWASPGKETDEVQPVLYLSYPRAGGACQGVAALGIGPEGVQSMEAAGRIGPGAMSGPTAVSARTLDLNMATVVTVNKIDTVGKVWTCLDVYAMEAGDSGPARSACVATGWVDGESVTQVCQGQGYPGFVGMVADHTLYVTAFEPDTLATGPTQAVAWDVERAEILPVGEEAAFCLCQSTGRGFYLRPLSARRVVRTARDGEQVDGTAIDPAKAGEQVRASIWRAYDDAYWAPAAGDEA